MSIIWTIVKWLIIGAGILVLSFILLSLVIFKDCNYQKELEIYKSLPKVRLEKLFKQMESMGNSHMHFLTKDEAVKLNPELSDLEFYGINFSHQSMIIGGCVDDKLILRFNDLGKPINGNPSITISWGEYPLRIETLWEK